MAGGVSRQGKARGVSLGVWLGEGAGEVWLGSEQLRYGWGSEQARYGLWGAVRYGWGREQVRYGWGSEQWGMAGGVSSGVWLGE